MSWSGPRSLSCTPPISATRRRRGQQVAAATSEVPRVEQHRTFAAAGIPHDGGRGGEVGDAGVGEELDGEPEIFDSRPLARDRRTRRRARGGRRAPPAVHEVDRAGAGGVGDGDAVVDRRLAGGQVVPGSAVASPSMNVTRTPWSSTRGPQVGELAPTAVEQPRRQRHAVEPRDRSRSRQLGQRRPPERVAPQLALRHPGDPTSGTAGAGGAASVRGHDEGGQGCAEGLEQGRVREGAGEAPDRARPHAGVDRPRGHAGAGDLRGSRHRRARAARSSASSSA